MVASSINFINGLSQIKKPYRQDRAFWSIIAALGRDDAHKLVTQSTLHRECNLAIHLGEQGVILAHADVLTRMHLGAALADDDAAGRNQLVAETLHAQSL